MSALVNESKNGFRCGIISVVGRPNVGKSTLINALVDNDILITSIHPHTTRRSIRAIDNTSEYQIIYVDTPGIHKPRNSFSENMNEYAYDALSGADIVLAVFDGSKNIGPGDRFIAEALNSLKNVYVILNKCDSENDTQRIALRLKEMSDLIPNAKQFFMISAFTKKNVHLLKKEMVSSLELSPALYPISLDHDMSDEQLVAEILRESIIRSMKEELPQSIGVRVMENTDRSGTHREFDAEIVVLKKSHKPIVISHSGSLLKNASIRTRKRIESLWAEPIILRTHVSVDGSWQSRQSDSESFFS